VHGVDEAGKAVSVKLEVARDRSLDRVAKLPPCLVGMEAYSVRVPLLLCNTVPLVGGGSNENLNGLIRQYLPRGTCMKRLTQKECDWIANELNTRPRKRHGFKTPAEIYHAS